MTQKNYSTRLSRRLDELANNEQESLEKILSINEVPGFVKPCQFVDRRGVALGSKRFARLTPIL